MINYFVNHISLVFVRVPACGQHDLDNLVVTSDSVCSILSPTSCHSRTLIKDLRAIKCVSCTHTVLKEGFN